VAAQASIPQNSIAADNLGAAGRRQLNTVTRRTMLTISAAAIPSIALASEGGVPEDADATLRALWLRYCEVSENLRKAREIHQPHRDLFYAREDEARKDPRNASRSFGEIS